jgi:hypothetical protein
MSYVYVSDRIVEAMIDLCRYPKTYQFYWEIQRDMLEKKRIWVSVRTLRQVAENSRRNDGDYGGKFIVVKSGSGNDHVHQFIPATCKMATLDVHKPTPGRRDLRRHAMAEMASIASELQLLADFGSPAWRTHCYMLIAAVRLVQETGARLDEEEAKMTSSV